MKALKLKPLNRAAIYHACEFLLLQQANISVAEVQNYLTDQNYEADFSYIQNAIDEFVETENWICNAAGRYSFSEDTDEVLDTVLCKGAKLTKIHVRDNVLIVKDLRQRRQEIKEYKSNRQAMFWAEELIKRQVAEGYYKK